MATHQHRALPTLRLLLLSGALLAATRVRAACPTNVAGGPDQVTLLTGQFAINDFDLGWTGSFQDLVPPAGTGLDLCLRGCNASTNPVCVADGRAIQPAGSAFGPPIPLVSAISPLKSLCIATRIASATLGTANVLTGAVNVNASLEVDISVQVGLSTSICPRCSGPFIGTQGRCDTGQRAGLPCTVNDTVTVPGAPSGSDTYNLSRDCLPTPVPTPNFDESGSLLLTGTLATATSTLSGSLPCPDPSGRPQILNDNCTESQCTGTCSAPNGQTCCADDANLSCFPTAPGTAGEIVRNGVPFPPLPMWPNATYPKLGADVLAGIFCAPSTGTPIIDQPTGLPGPAAMVLPSTAVWNRAGASSTTTTTIPPPSTETIVPLPTLGTGTGTGTAFVPCDAAGGRCTPSGLFAVAPCGPHKVGPALRGRVQRALLTARQVAGAGRGLEASRLEQLRAAANRDLDVAARRTGRAMASGRISDACGRAIDGAIGRARGAVSGS
jgi:hypothetical protein